MFRHSLFPCPCMHKPTAFQLEMLEPRLLLSADGMAVAITSEVVGGYVDTAIVFEAAEERTEENFVDPFRGTTLDDLAQEILPSANQAEPSASPQILVLEIGPVLRLTGNYTELDPAGPDDPIAVVNDVEVEILNEFASWQPSVTIDGVELYDGAAEIDLIAFDIDGGIGASGSIMDFTNLQAVLTNLRVTFTEEGGVRSNFQVIRGSIGLRADSATMFGSAADAVEITVGGDGGLSGLFDLTTGDLTVTAGEVNVKVGSALEVEALNLTYTFASESPAPGVTLGSVESARVTTSEIKDGEGNPLTLTLDPSGSTPAILLRSDGFTITNGELAVSSFAIDGVLEVSNFEVELENVSYSSAATSNLTGTVSFSAASTILYPGQTAFTSTVTNLRGSYELGSETSGLTLEADAVSVTIGEALKLDATGISFTPGGSPLATIASVTLSSPQFSGVGTAEIKDLEIRRDGFSIGEATLTPGNGGSATIGNFISFTGLTVQAEDFSYTVGAASAISGTVTVAASTITLFPNGGLVKSSIGNFSASYDFTQGGRLEISAGTFALSIGEAVKLEAAGVVLTPGQNTILQINSALLRSPTFSNFGVAVVSDIQIFQDGFTLGSFELAQPAGQTATFGSLVSFTGLSLNAVNFGVTYGATTTVRGTVTVSASSVRLFPNGGTLRSTIEDFELAYEFDEGGGLNITVGSFALAIGEALEITASEVQITPGKSQIATIAEATLRSPQFAGLGTIEISDLVLRQDGLSVGNAVLEVANGGTASIGTFLEVSGLKLEAVDFGVTYGNTTAVTGTLSVTATSIELFPNGGFVRSSLTGVNATYDFNDGGRLAIQVDSFSLEIGEALKLEATDVLLTPGAEEIATIAEATLRSPQFSQVGTATLSNFVVRQDGFSIGNATLAVANGGTASFGQVISFTNLKIEANEFGVTIGSETEVSGTISVTADEVALFPGNSVFSSELQDFSASYDFESGGQLEISIGEFALRIGQALELSASNVLITPGAETIVSIEAAEVSSPGFSNLGTFTIEDLEIRSNGLSLGSAVFEQPEGTTATFGSVLELEGVVIEITDFSVAVEETGTTVTGTVELRADSIVLFPNGDFLNSSLEGVTASYDFSQGGRLEITVATFSLKVGEALELTAAGVEITPGEAQIAKIGSATLKSPQFAQLGTVSVTDFVLNQDGFEVADLTLEVANGGTATIGSFISATGLRVKATDFAVSYGASSSVSGQLTVTASSVALFPNGGFVTSEITGITAVYDFGNGGELSITVDNFALVVGEALRLEATGVKITPGQDEIAVIESATIESPQFPQLGTVTIEDFVVRQDGFSLGNATLSVANGGNASIGSVVTFSNLKVQAIDFEVTIGTETTVDGQLLVTADDIALFPNGGVISSELENFSATYDFEDDGQLKVTVGEFTLQVGEALLLSASNVVITPGAETIASIESAFVTSPGLSNLGTLTIENLEIRQDGITLGSLVLEQPEGLTANFGSFLSLTGVKIELTDFSALIGAGGTTISGTIKLTAANIALFPNGTFITSTLEDFSAVYDFGDGGRLEITVGTFALAIGEALELTAEEVVITPGQSQIAKIGSATVRSPQFSQLGTATLTDFILNQDGFEIGDLTLEVANGGTVTMGSFLSVTGLKVQASDFVVKYGSTASITGTITFEASNLSLFPGASAFTTTVTGLTGSYEFANGTGSLTINLASLDLKIGSALNLHAENIKITPGENVISTIALVTVSSPMISGLENGTITNLEIRQDGFSLGSLTIAQKADQTAQIGSVLAFSGAVISVTDFTFTTSPLVTFSGSVALNVTSVQLMPTATFLTSNFTEVSASFSFSSNGVGDLTITIGTFELLIGQALRLNATNIVITPSAQTILTIENATVTSPQLSNLGSGVLEKFEVTQTGFSIESFTLTQAEGQMAVIGNFLSFTEVVLKVEDFSVVTSPSVKIEGSITFSADDITLFPNASFLISNFQDTTITYEFTPTSSQLTIEIGEFALALGEALEITASDVLITPDQTQLAKIGSGTIRSPKFTNLPTAAFENFVITQTGFSLGALTLTQAAGQTTNFGSFLSFSGLVITASNLEVQYGSSSSVSGTVTVQASSVVLFPGSSFLTSDMKDITGTYDFGNSGKMSIEIGEFNLSIGEALLLEATDVAVTPGEETIAEIGTMTVSSPMFSGLPTGSLSNLKIRQDGFSLGSLVLTQAAGQAVDIGGFLSFSGVSVSINNFSYTSTDGGSSVSGNIGFGAESITLFPGSSLVTSEITSFSGSYDFGTGKDGDLVITAGSFKLNIANVIEILATSVEIKPNAEIIADIGSATVSSPRFANLPAVTLTGLKVRDDGFSIDELTLTQNPESPISLAGIFEFSGLEISVADLEFTFGGAASMGGAVTISADSASLFPTSTVFSATATGFTGSFNLNSPTGDISLHADGFEFKFGTTLTITATSIDFTPDAVDVIGSAGSLSATIPSLGITGTATDLQVTKSGDFSVVSISLVTEGLAKSLGLGNFLPFDITELEVEFLGDENGNGQRDTGEIFKLTEFILTVTGTFNFTKFGSLPFTPILKIGDTGDESKSFTDGSTPFTFSIIVEDGEVKPYDIGPIEIGFEDLKIGSNVTMAGSIMLGGYEEGVFQTSFGGSISMKNSGNISGITGAGVSITGDYDADTGTITALAALSLSFKMGSSVQVDNATLNFNMVLKTGDGFSISVDTLKLDSATVDKVTLAFGSLMTMVGTNVAINLNPAEGDYIASFGSLSVTLTGLGLGGTARQFAIDEDGNIATLPGFAVTLDVSDPSKFSWPAWLPIQITFVGITWTDFENDILDFQITLSASVTKIENLPLEVSGLVEGVVIDIGALTRGEFPITDITSVGVSIGGEAFGGEVEGSLFLSVLKMDANNELIPVGDNTTEVAKRVFYGGIEAGFNFGGMSGFSIRIGLSELGPLELYLSASIPVLLEPTSGLAITDFRAGVTFNSTLPSITDPMELEGNEFKPKAQQTLQQWKDALEVSVVNQVKNSQPGDSFWDQFTAPMKIEGGATLFSLYASQNAFKADIDIILSTDGKFLINARMTFGSSLSLDGILYADLSNVSSGAATILFLAHQPAKSTTPPVTPIMTYFGSIAFGFTTADGSDATPTNPADTFQITVSGGVKIQALSFAAITISGSVTMSFADTRFDLDLTGSVNISYLGDAIGVAGALHLVKNGDTYDMWGALVMTPNFDKLEKIGLYVDGAALWRLNITDDQLTEVLDVPGRGEVTVDLEPYSFSVLIEGYIVFQIASTEWFRMEGAFGMEFSQTGFDVFMAGLSDSKAKLLIGPSSNPWITFTMEGFMQISGDGIAAKLDIYLDDDFPDSFGITMQSTYLLQMNTTGKEISYTLPESILDPPGDETERTITVSAGPTGPLASGAQPYLQIDATGTFKVLGFEQIGDYHFLISPSIINIEARTSMSLSVAGVSIFEFTANGGLRIDNDGVAAAIELTRKVGSSDPAGFGLEGDLSFRFELNTTGEEVTLAGITLRADHYALVRIDGTMVITGLKFVGYFEIYIGDGGFLMQAYASLDLTIASTKIFSFTVSGGFLINDKGIAASFLIELATGLPDNLGFTLEASFRIEVNTTSEEVEIAGVTIEAGPYAKVAADGVLAVEGFEIDGSFAITVSSSYLEMYAEATLQVQLLGVRLFSFNVLGGFRISDKGIAAVLTLSLEAGVPASFGFSFEASFTLKVNTTNAVQTIGTETLDAGIYGTLEGDGLLIVGGLELDGGFLITVGVGLVHIEADASLDLEVGGVKLLSFAVVGGLQVDDSGIAAAFSISLNVGGGFPSSFPASFSATFRIEVNMTGAEQTFDTLTLEAGYYARIYASGTLTVSGFGFSGEFWISAGTDGFTIGAKVTFDLFITKITAVAQFGLYSDGLAVQVLLDITEGIKGLGDFFTLKGSFGLEINTTNRTIFGVSPNTARVYVQGAKISILGFTISGSLSIGVVNNQFIIDVPESDPLTLDFFGFINVEVYGYIRGDGQFSITGSVSIVLGREDLVGISGTMTVHVENKGFSASLEGAVVAFNQNILTVTGLIEITTDGFRLVATATLSLPSPLDIISLSANVDITVNSSGIKASISASVSLWSFLNGSVGGYIDTSTGSWFLHGSASFSVGNDNLGASGYLSIDVGYLTSGQTLFGAYRTAGFHTVLTAGGSAWAGFEVFGYFVGISVGLDVTVDLGNASLSVKISGSVGIDPLSIGWSKTITIEFRNGVHIYLSDVAGSLVYLDLDNDDILDDGEPWTVADEKGRFTFDIPEETTAVIPSSVGRVLLVGGINRNTGVNNTSTIVLPENRITFATNYAQATVFLDVNGNSIRDAAEAFTTTDSTGVYSLASALVSTYSGTNADAALGALKPFDLNKDHKLDSSEGQFVLFGGTTLDTGVPSPGTRVLTSYVPSGFTNVTGGTVYFDVNKNLTLDAGEIFRTTSGEGRFSFVTSDPDPSAQLGALAAYDLNKNGILEDSEGVLYAIGGTNIATGDTAPGLTRITNDHLSGFSPNKDTQRVFFDVNKNQAYDVGEPQIVPNTNGFYSFLNIEASRGSLGALKKYDKNNNDIIDAEEGVFKVIGGNDKNNGLPNVQSLQSAATPYASGVRYMANPLAHIHSELVILGSTEAQADALIDSAFGLPAFTDVRSFDPNVPENQADDEHYDVLGASSMISQLILNGVDLLQGAAKGNLSDTDAQEALYAAIAGKIATITSYSEPAFDSTGTRIVAYVAKVDFQNSAVISEIYDLAAQLVEIKYSDAPPAGTALSRMSARLQGMGAPARRGISISQDVLNAAGTVVATNNSHIDDLVDNRVSNIKASLAGMKHLGQKHSSNLLDKMARGELTPLELLSMLELDDIKQYLNNLNTPAGQHLAEIAFIPHLAATPGETVSVSFEIEDPDELPHDLTVSILSSDHSIVRPEDIQLSRDGTLVTLTAKVGQGRGETVITIRADDGRAVAERSFSIFTAPQITAWSSSGQHTGAGEALLPIFDDGFFTESRTSGLTRLYLEFSHEIDPASFTAANVFLAGNSATGAVDLSSYTVTVRVDASGLGAVMTFNKALPDQAVYRLRIDGIKGADGSSLIGDNDRVMNALAGDVCGDLVVNSADASGIRDLISTTPLTATELLKVRSDLDGDGVVTSNDYRTALGLRGHGTLNIQAPTELKPILIVQPAISFAAALLSPLRTASPASAFPSSPFNASIVWKTQVNLRSGPLDALRPLSSYLETEESNPVPLSDYEIK